MADNFNDPFAGNLVGLWDFLSGSEQNDTGVADGVSQNGWLHGNANISGDELHLDGKGDRFEVDGEIIGSSSGDSPNAGDDDPFQLDEGTMSVQFNQDAQVGSSDDTIVSRGEYDDRGSEGYFDISVSDSGRVKVMHYANGEYVKLETSKDFFEPGDDVKVTYTWSVTDGGTFKVENLTYGTEYVSNYSTTGMSMDIGDQDDESFTFGAREKDDGEHDRFFNGSIDYVAIYDVDVINNPPLPDPDGIVDGTNAGEVIDVNYDGDPEGDKIDNNDAIIAGEGPQDDIVDALGGNDTILAGEGNDDVYAGSGDDSVDGGAGDDLIYGDSNLPGGGATTTRESFEWDLQGVAHGGDLNGFTQDTGNVNVTFSVLQETGNSVSEFSDEQQKVHSITDDGNPVDVNSSLQTTTNGQGNQADYQLAFDSTVDNVSFRINDIDGDGVVRVTAYDANNNPITVNMSGGSNLTLLDTDSVAGVDTADSNGDYAPDTSPQYSVLVNIPGPVSRIVIEHDQNGSDNSGVNVTDVYYDATVGVDDNGADGNDTLLGGIGEDTIFGEDGNDRLDGGNDDDYLDGGDDRDTILGGAGDDTAIGGAGNDEIWMGSGNDSVDGGTENDWIHGQSGNDTLNGEEGDDMLFGEAGDDVLTGGEGADLLDGGADADTIFGGAGDVVDGGAGGFNANPALNTDEDTLDLTGQGPFILENVTADSNGNGTNGTVVFVDGAGNPTGETLTFTEIESIMGDDVTNNDPDAVDDSSVTDEDTAVVVNLIGNDTDPNGDPLTVTSATVPANQGSLVDNGDGTVTFTPAENFNGTATISYSITDGNGGTDSATHTVEVAPINDDPVAVDDTETTDEDTSVVVDLIGNDTDVDGDTLTLGTATVPASQGTLVDNGDGTVTFTPAQDFNGDATISYTVLDGNGGSDTGEAVITVTPVNDGPDAVNDADVTDEDTAVTVDLLANDTDPENDTLTVTGATVPGDQGTLVDNGDGTVTFTPAENFNGTATISYSITDGNGGTDTAIHEIVVTPVNDDPVAVDDAVDTDEDTAVTFDLVGNDTDVDGDPLTIGTVSVPADQGTVVDNGDGTVTFTPADNFNGPATITYTVVDGQGGEDTGEATVNVMGVNDGPTANDDSDVTDEDTAITVDLIGNDTDEEGDPLTVTSASVPGDQGTLVDNGDGTVTFTPAANFNGEATISYSITDGNGGTDSAQHVITVTPVNDDPVAVDDIETTDEDQAIVIDLIGNDTDVDGDPLTIGAVSVDPALGTVVDNGDGTVTFTPAQDYNGPVTIDYTVEDGQGGSDDGQAIVSVGAVNDGPVANDDTDTTDEDVAVTVDLIGNDTDADGDPLTVISATVPADQGTLVDNGDGTVTFTPAQDFNGDATISYEISDGQGGTDTATHTVVVGAVNDGPDAVNDDAGEVVVGNTITIDALENDTDPEDDPLMITSATVPANQGVAVVVGNMIEFTPADSFEGEATISYTIEDPDGGSDTAEITVFVRDGIVTGTDDGDLIDVNYTGDPGNDMVDTGDNVFSGDPADADDDIIVAGGGDDTIIAGSGDDSVDAGTGDDQVNGGTGNDTINGGAGNDTLQGAAGDDIIDGGEGDDSITGGGDNDTLTGGEGNDTLSGSAGNDSVDGGVGDDSISGGLADDTLDGGDGNDTIDGGDGSDSVLGGAGDDVIDTDNGSFQIDKGYPGLFPGEEGTPGAEDDRDFVDGGDGNDTIRTGDDRDTIIGGAGDDVIDGGIDDDVITGDDGDDRIVGGEGSDDIQGGAGNDTIYAGNDPVLGLDGLNIEDDGSNPFGPDLRPDNGVDTVSGGDGDDVIYGADDADILMGDAGNDFIDGGIDNDTIDGGIGDDTLIGGQGNDSIDGGDGNDSIDAGRNADVVNGGDGDDTISGGNGADVLNGDDGDDFIDGGTGDDTLNGGAGNDSITGATGDDVIDGGSGNDTIDGGNGGQDIMSGGDDEDLFINVTAGEVVDGGEGVTDTSDFDTLDLTGSAPNNGSLQVVYDPGNPENGVVNYFDENGDDAGQLQFTNIENVIPCFTPGTLIATPKGERKVEDLMVGDRVITRDNGIQEIRWVGAREMSGAELEMATHLKPVLIRQGALGGDLPERDMMVSPNHRVLMANDKTALYFEEREVLVAAKFLTGLDGVDVVDVSGTTYIHLMFDAHEVILSDGTWTESFQPGDQTLAGVGDAQRQEILELFPELATETGIDAYTSARRSLKKHEARLLTK